MIRNHNNQLSNLYEYDPYGNALTTYGTESFNYYRFTGAELDKDSSNFYYFPFRYYAPALQRRMIRDPAGMADSTNLHAYVRNSAVNLYDPLGLAVRVCIRPLGDDTPWLHTWIEIDYGNGIVNSYAYDQRGFHSENHPDHPKAECVQAICPYDNPCDYEFEQWFQSILRTERREAIWQSGWSFLPWQGGYNLVWHNCNSFTNRMLTYMGCASLKQHFPNHHRLWVGTHDR